MERSNLPVAVIGAGPVGLAAAAQLVRAGETPLVLERGAGPGASLRAWSHVRVFTPWRYVWDRAAHALLTASGWQQPDGDHYPTGGEIVRDYLEPLAALPAIQPHLRVGARVTAVTRLGFDKMKTAGRDEAPFQLSVELAGGGETTLLAKAVIDASGTWLTPNPLGASGVPAPGERAAADAIWYGIPDVLGRERARYAGKRVLVVGAGHSAFNALTDLVQLAREEPGTRVTWAIRRAPDAELYGGGEADGLSERGSLGQRVKALVDAGDVTVAFGIRIARVERTPEGIVVGGGDGRVLAPVDEIVATTGFRPDLTILSELRLAIDPAVESTPALAPLIDPNVHSCGTVRPHGAEELRHPERDFYIVGMKSYGRAPTFLMLTGYEQARSVVAAIRGDWEAARRVELELPETGVCSVSLDAATATAACCGPVRTAEREPALVGAGTGGA